MVNLWAFVLKMMCGGLANERIIMPNYSNYSYFFPKKCSGGHGGTAPTTNQYF